MPRLTVIMPARNAEATAAGAVRSTLRAMPRDAELVVWDDASEDRTSEVVESIADPRVSVLRGEQRRGSGAARRELMARTDSELVANIDADDVSLPWRFRVQLRHLSYLDASFATTFRFRGNLRSVRWSGGYAYTAEETPLALVVHNVLPHSTFVARRSAVESAGGYRALPVAQDYDLWLRMAANGARLGRLRTPTAAYRQSPTQVSGARDYHARANEQAELRDAYAALAERVLGEPLRPGDRGLKAVQEATLARVGELAGERKRAYYRTLIESGTTFQLLPPG